MLNVRRDITVRLAIEPVDFRKSIDGLAIAVGQALGRDPMAGEVFVFRNRTRTALKALYWTKNGFVLVYKRLERLRFTLPDTADGVVEVRLPPEVLEDLLAGASRACQIAGS